MIDLGAAIRLTASCTDAGGTPANADSVTLTLTLPDGTTTSPAVTNPPAVVGQYSVDYTAAQPGRHAVHWQFASPTAAYADVFDVRPADPGFLFSLADAKKHLNIAATSTSDDDEIRDWSAATTWIVEHFVGPVARRTITERHTFTVAAMRVLRHTPALALTSVVPVLTSGTSYDPAALDLDPDTGIVQRLDGGLLYGPLRFTYTAGRARATANITAAGRVILQHLWRTQRGSGRGPVIAGGDDYAVSEPIAGLGYAIPNRALELLEPDRLPPGVA
ncbi:hypothetical protein RI578_06460 [Streptomyces sp. BB1-1-1]|uniref:hypothetical protein n=1 Tax=Streptomyces sp. BB1-1-1 TaxID=3074430 RepID=UPI002877EEE5|nr:hypothetical protein [Streptomyces sp. BB1-1-1]WND33955.1 hypothetical protein RI578_06460 [Streptomyces sp. BB1-1-1]